MKPISPCQGYTVQCASRFDRKPITVLLNGFLRPSENKKTGPMVQVYITPTGKHPVEVQRDALASRSICSNCPQLPATGGGCYVSPYSLLSLPQSIENAQPLQSTPSSPPLLSPLRDLLRYRPVRIGTWGDPAAVAARIMLAIAMSAKMRTGYTHFPEKADHLRGYVQASCDTLHQARKAWCAGWKTFRVVHASSISELRKQRIEGEIICPHHTKGIQCIACGLCDGSKANILAPIHGNKSRHYKT
jgi:hypothetical protein